MSPQVWLLLGGDPEAAPSFLASGLDIMLRLGQCEDLQVRPGYLCTRL